MTNETTKRKKKKGPDPYSEETIKKKRKFPTVNTVVIIVALCIQVIILAIAILNDPKPQDRIDNYEIVATPRSDGTVDLEYRFVWTALDTSEDLTWVEIGMPNKHFEFYKDAFSNNIESYEKYIDGDYVSARLDFKRPYKGGETLEFSFCINQRELLCQDDDGYFYELIPGWFNSTPVEHYRFIWKASPKPLNTNTSLSEFGDPVWEGSMPQGTYVALQLYYAKDAFPADVATVEYEEFYDGDVFDSLKDDKSAGIAIAVVFCLGLLALQVYLIDSVVSYHRGRGFLTGYGHHIHVYGRTNPKYEAEQKKHAARSGGRSGGGSCACACACACAGGGRAGCSQKDTKAFVIKSAKSIE